MLRMHNASIFCAACWRVGKHPKNSYASRVCKLLLVGIVWAMTTIHLPETFSQAVARRLQSMPPRHA